MKILARKKTVDSNKNEQRFLNRAHDFFLLHTEPESKFYNLVVLPEHEPMTFHTSDLSYTPDFVGKMLNGEMAIIEVKANKRQKGYYYSRARMIASSLILPTFNWIIVETAGKDNPEFWKLKEVSSDD